ncbi:MAG TPA: ABC transporter permease [Gemmatimonadales bacterium]|nr:ABC transporter permease [Gemmatimonadales bacterium]
MTPGLAAGFGAAAVRIATPLLLAALGETVAERGGVLDLGIEGAMLVGALASVFGAVAGGPWCGILVGAAAGAITAAVFAAVALGAGADQVVTGTAVTLGATGLTGAIYRLTYGSASGALQLTTLPNVHLPLLGALPVIGPAFFDQPMLTYACYLAVPTCWWILFRTRWGLELRAAGESPVAAAAAGVRVLRVRVTATVIGGAFAGLAGASLVLTQTGTFAENMTAGRGFIAIAIVVLGRWSPFRVAIAALAFGALTALQFLLQGLGFDVPYQLFLVLPYAVALLALGGAVGRTRAPESLGR